jgi:hypothetical protein
MKNSIKVLQDLIWQLECVKYPRMPKEYVAKKTYTDKTANGLTKCIIDWIKANGYQAERISNTGRYIDNSKIVTDSMGFQKKIGSGQYIKGTGTNGTADISAIIRTIKGTVIPWKIEVKISRDRQSEAQKKYQADIEKVGGIYTIAKDFDQFIADYTWIMENK